VTARILLLRSGELDRILLHSNASVGLIISRCSQTQTQKVEVSCGGPCYPLSQCVSDKMLRVHAFPVVGLVIHCHSACMTKRVVALL